MAWNEAAYLTPHNATATPGDLTAITASMILQNVTAAQSTLTDYDVAGQHQWFSDISIYTCPSDGYRSSWGGDA